MKRRVENICTIHIYLFLLSLLGRWIFIVTYILIQYGVFNKLLHKIILEIHVRTSPLVIPMLISDGILSV